MAENPEESTAPESSVPAAPAVDPLAAMKKSMDDAHRAAIEAEQAVARAGSSQTTDQEETEGN